MTPEAVTRAISQLPEDDRIDVEERAAIMEHDGGLSRAEAERWALKAWQRQQEVQPQLFGEDVA